MLPNKILAKVMNILFINFPKFLLNSLSQLINLPNVFGYIATLVLKDSACSYDRMYRVT